MNAEGRCLCSAVTFVAEDVGAELHVCLSMGSLDDQQRFRIASEIYVDDKPAGYDFAGVHPRLTGEEFLASLQKK